MDGDAVLLELGSDHARQFGVEGGEDFTAALQLRDLHPAGGECFGHLQADVAGADDDRRRGLAFGEVLVEGERVAHRVNHVDPVVRPEMV